MKPSPESLQYGTSRIEYTVIPSKRKTVSIQVAADIGVEVRVPLSFDQGKVPALIREKAPWILEKLRLINDQVSAPKHEFVSGERFLYLGRRYRLHVRRLDTDNQAQLRFSKGSFLAWVPSDATEGDHAELLKPLFVKFYREKAEERLWARVDYYATLMNVEPRAVKVTDLQKKRWASCDHGGVLRFNWRIVMATAKALDYVVVHELAHLRHRDHSVLFWKLVERILPDHEVRREWLRTHGPELDLG